MFGLKRTLGEHVKEIHENNRLSKAAICDFCNKSFGKQYLEEHVNKVHVALIKNEIQS